MQTGPRLAFLVIACLLLTMAGCRPRDMTADPAVQGTPNPESTTGEPLSEAEVLEIVRSSLATYPWRMEQNLRMKDSGQTIASLTEAESGRRGYNRSEQSLGGDTITLESILVESQLYLKITGSPADAYGLVSGEWTEVLPDSPLKQFVDTSAIDPAKLAEIFAADFKAVSGEGGVDELTFAAAGNEELNGLTATIYEAAGETFTYRWWIGTDGRFYKSTVDLPRAERTIVMEYDPGIEVVAPLP